MTPDTILDAEAVAEHLRCSVAQAEDLMRAEELPATKIGRGWITTYSELLSFVARRIKTERKSEESVKVHVVGKKKGGPRALPRLPELSR